MTVTNRLVLMGCACLAASAAPARADTLEDALRHAYERNPALSASRQLARAAAEGVAQARASYGPSLDVSIRHQFTASRIRGTAFPSEDAGFSTSGEVSLSQPLFTSGRLAAGLDAARAGRMIAAANLESAGQRLIFEVVSAYVALRRDLELYRVASGIRDLLLLQRDSTAARLRLHDQTQPDLDQTVNRFELAAGRVISARAAVEASAARYRNLVGAYPGELADPPALPALPPLDGLYVQAETTSPDLVAAQFAEARSRALVGSARAAMRPQVAAFAAAARAPLSPYGNTLRQEQVVGGVSLSMPLYSGGQQSALLREAIARNLADQLQVEQARRDMRERLAADWALFAAASDALPRYRSAVTAAESAVAGVERQQRAGMRTLRDVLEVTNDLLVARTSAVQADADTYIRKVAVLRDAGLLSPALFAVDATVPPKDDPAGVPPHPLAGLPLRPVIEPLDRALLDDAVGDAGAERERSDAFVWPEGKDAPADPSGVR